MPWISGEAEQMWQNARSAQRKVWRHALNYWAWPAHQKTLPGPLFFSIPQAELHNRRWRRVVDNSYPKCPCGERRWFAPTDSHDYYPYDEPQLVVLGEGQQQLALGPWGGDTQSTIMQLSVQGGTLHIRLLPYAGLSRDEVRTAGFGIRRIVAEVEGKIHTVPDDRSQGYRPLARLAQQMNNLTGPLTVRMLIPTCESDESNQVICRPFGIYGVNLEQMTLTIAVGRNFQAMNPADRSEFHICKP